MDDGVISWDEQGNLQFIKPRRRESCALTRRQVREGQSRTLNVTRRIATSNKTGTSAQHVEATFESQHQFIDAVITLNR